jgi:serine/threonine protein phosphatase 1
MNNKQRDPRGTPGKRLYAIGDIHGRYDLLCKLLDKIDRRNASLPPKDTSIVLLGDLIDKGPQSSKVLQLLTVAEPDKYRLYALMGNHEELMLRSLQGDPHSLNVWLRNGGDATLKSYGLEPEGLLNNSLTDVQRKLYSAFDAYHVTLVRTFLDSIRFGDYLLVHAGIRPDVEIEKQVPQDLRWIREPFLSSQSDHGLVIVHGHSAWPEIVERSNRVGIDTCAWKTGILTAMRIEDQEREFLQVIELPAPAA